MTSTVVHHTHKQRGFSSFIMVAANLLFMSATLIGLFNPTTAHGAGANPQQIGLGKGINMLFSLPNTSVPSPHLDLYVFFTRPLPCVQDPNNCNGNIKLYAPDSKVHCSSPVPQAITSASKNPSLAWVSNGEECPYLNCNWMPVDKGCSTLTTDTVFEEAPPSLSALGNVYMKQSMDFTSVVPNSDYGFSGCIYYENWPQFPLRNTQVLMSGSNIQLATSGSVVTTPLPDGITLQTIQTAIVALPKTIAGSRSSSDPGTWG